MAALGAILGAVGGSASEGMASAAQYQASKHERNVAWRRQQAWELMAPSLRVAGLRAAGLNPILAATQGMTGGPGHIATASTGGSPRFDTDIAGKAISAAKQASFMKDQAAILALQRQEQLEKVKQAVADTNVKQKFSEAQAKAELDVTQEQMLNLVAQRGFTSARTQESEQAKRRIEVDRLLMELGVPGARAMEEMYNEYPWLRQVREFSGGSLGGAAIGAAGAGAGFLMRGVPNRSQKESGGFGSMRPGKSKRRK